MDHRRAARLTCRLFAEARNSLAAYMLAAGLVGLAAAADLDLTRPLGAALFALTTGALP